MGVSAGRVLLIPKGDWNAEATYTGLDWVRHNGSAWVCKNTCTNVEPTEENSDNWQIMARDGESGSVITVDATMSDTSENPVQNKVIKKYVDDHSADVSDMIGATADQNGTHGLVPAPQIGDEKKALLGDGTWGSVDAIFTYKTKEEYDAAVENDEIPDGAKVIKEYDEEDQSSVIDVDAAMSDTSVNPVQNKVIKKYVDEKQVKPGDGLAVTEDETLKVNIDGVTLTMDQVNNVIKLADTLKDKIGSALQPESIVNNQITTVEGFALDARQANPNLDGTLAKQISDLNGSLKEIKLTRYNIKGIDTSSVQCFVKNNVAYVNVGVYYHPKEAINDWTKIVSNLPIPAYTKPKFIGYSKNASGTLAGLLLNEDGELLIKGGTLSYTEFICSLISYPIKM